MKLLPFTMPSSCRIQFVSQQAKEVWESKLALANECYKKLEWMTVKNGLRKCATALIKDDSIPASSRWYASHGLILLPVFATKQTKNGHTHKAIPPKPGEKANWFCVVSRSIEDAYTWLEADKINDHETKGILLGYPKCCRDFFTETWNNGYIDPTWQQAENSSPEIIKNTRNQFIRLSKNAPWEISTMLRYIGIRAVSHIPCSHDCNNSLNIAKDWIQLGEELKLEGLDELKELLQTSVEWNASHGIAYITTPIFKIEVDSVTCPSPYIVQKEGTFVPDEKARGLKFPFL